MHKTLRMIPVILAFAAVLAVLPVVRGAEHQVVVGGPGILQYTPDTIDATPGDVVTFVFKQKNHTVTQSTFQTPCQALSGGFDSGFVPVADNNTDGPFTIAQFSVVDTNPVWVYCRQANHCQQGMVFAINPGNKFAAFQAAAMGNSSAQQTSATASAVTSSAAASATAPPPAQSTIATSSTPSTQPATTISVPSPSSTITMGAGTNHMVVVGGPSMLIFTPANITAQIGDTITFSFRQTNHTVTQSSFASPCTSLTQSSTSGQVGFDSGFMPVGASDTVFPSFTITVNDTSPIWAFCKQTNPIDHCADGMVFAANAIESGPNNFEAFEAKAKLTTATSSVPAPSGSATTTPVKNGAKSLSEVPRGAGIAVALVALFFSLL